MKKLNGLLYLITVVGVVFVGTFVLSFHKAHAEYVVEGFEIVEPVVATFTHITPTSTRTETITNVPTKWKIKIRDTSGSSIHWVRMRLYGDLYDANLSTPSSTVTVFLSKTFSSPDVTGNMHGKIEVSGPSYSFVTVAETEILVRTSHIVTVTKGGNASGAVVSLPIGIDCGPDCTSASTAFPLGAVVTFTAAPGPIPDPNIAQGTSFNGWGGQCSGNQPSCTFTVGSASSVIANFRAPYHINDYYTHTPSTITPSIPATWQFGAYMDQQIPGNITWAEMTWSDGYVASTTVTNQSNFSFTRTFDTSLIGLVGAQLKVRGGSIPAAMIWSGTSTVVGVGENNPTITLVINDSVLGSIRATTTDSSGTIHSSLCPPQCSLTVPYGTRVILSPQSDNYFMGWNGLSSPSFLATSSLNIKAFFAEKVLHVWKAGPGKGSLSIPDVMGLSECNSDYCKFGYRSLVSPITITATPFSSGSVFARWSGGVCDDSPSDSCVVPQNSFFAGKMIFRGDKWFETKVVVNNGTLGKITKSNSSFSCSGTCVATSTPSSTITFIAQPARGSVFTGWSGRSAGKCAGSTSMTCTLVSNIDRTITATFTKNLSLTLLKEGSGKGVVASTPVGVQCDESCTRRIITTTIPNTKYKLTATPSSKSTFLGWQVWGPGTEECARSPVMQKTCTVTVGEGTMVIATFGEKQDKNLLKELENKFKTQEQKSKLIEKKSNIEKSSTLSAEFVASVQAQIDVLRAVLENLLKQVVQ